MIRQTTRLLLAVLLFSVWGSAALPEERPDLTGVWMPDSASSLRFRNDPHALPYSEAGLAALSRFEEMYPGDTYDMTAFCVHMEMPWRMDAWGGYWMEFIQRSERLTIVAETGGPARRIYTDGREYPEDIYPTRSGYSLGRWENHILVVETVGLLAIEGPIPSSSKQRIIERISFDSDDMTVLVNQITIHDPEILSKPFSFTVRYNRWPDDELLNYECTEGAWMDHLRSLKENRETD